MNRSLQDAGLVRKYEKPMDGVFTRGDLCRLFHEDNDVSLFRRIKTLEEAGVFSRFIRGIYVTPGYEKESLVTRIIEDCYLSLGTILARELMIGSIPAKTLYAVRIGKARTFEGLGLTVQYVGVAPQLFFGFTTEHGVRRATPEKALLDTLYFYLLGMTYSFDIYQDVDISRINQNIVLQYLQKYRNPRYVSFVKGYLNDWN